MNRQGKILLSATGGVVLFALLYPHLTMDLPPRHDVIETLRSPIRVLGWTGEGFVAEDGEIMSLPGIESLPLQSPILNEIIRRGIEVDPDDRRVYGLLSIHHWCGNDPIDKHVARVDVASLVKYLQARTSPGNRNASFQGWACDSVTEWGWNVSCFLGYERWLEEAGQPK